MAVKKLKKATLKKLVGGQVAPKDERAPGSP